LKKLRRNTGEENSENGCRHDANENGLVALFTWQARRRKPNDNGVIASKHQVNCNYLHQSDERFAGHQGFKHASRA
jgi:hypothetical protein